jgi:nicotinamide mononucleotide adenylyltransferase
MEDQYALFKRSYHLKIYYFIGRLNPPHEGHIRALIQMIEEANSNGSVALILIGSGPKGLRTMDNPVTFETKKEFLRYIIPPELKYVVRHLTNPMGDVEQWYHNVLAHIEEPSKVSFIRFAGDKGDNATKFKHLDNRFQTLHTQAESVTIPIPPVMASANKEMSATIVRKTAYKCLLMEHQGKGDGFSMFREEYGSFYKAFCEQIYREIIEVVQEVSPSNVERYIETTKLPKKAKTKKATKSKSSSKSKSKRPNASSSSDSNS